MSNMRTIRVTGKGLIKVHPDMTRITMTLEGMYPEYTDSLRHSAEDTERLKDVLSPFGFARSDLKTLNFSVDTAFESYKDKDVYKQRFIGYKFQLRGAPWYGAPWYPCTIKRSYGGGGVRVRHI